MPDMRPLLDLIVGLPLAERAEAAAIRWHKANTPGKGAIWHGEFVAGGIQCRLKAVTDTATAQEHSWIVRLAPLGIDALAPDAATEAGEIAADGLVTILEHLRPARLAFVLHKSMALAFVLALHAVAPAIRKLDYTMEAGVLVLKRKQGTYGEIR